jgi:hypothetical protein
MYLLLFTRNAGEHMFFSSTPASGCERRTRRGQLENKKKKPVHRVATMLEGYKRYRTIGGGWKLEQMKRVGARALEGNKKGNKRQNWMRKKMATSNQSTDLLHLFQRFRVIFSLHVQCLKTDHLARKEWAYTVCKDYVEAGEHPTSHSFLRNLLNAPSIPNSTKDNTVPHSS